MTEDEDGATLFNDTGWQAGYRYNSSGNIVSADGAYITGFIPITKGETITFENMTLAGVTSATHYDWCKLVTFGSDKSTQYAHTNVASLGTSSYGLDSDNNITTIRTKYLNETMMPSTTAFFRISCIGMSEESAIYIE